jgi:hypothetical protein
VTLLTVIGIDKIGPSGLPNRTVRFFLFWARASGSCPFRVTTHFDNSVGESTTSSTLREWYGPWTLPLIHFNSRWSEPAEGFGHGDYCIGDDCYGSVGHQQDRKAPRQKNQTVRNAKRDHPVSLKTTTASDQQHKQWVPEAVSSVDGSGGNQDQTS